ncbi:MAG: gluconolactonase [Panacagrimonas sp.]|nr:SMP-30/gluconolactonase/LRE family protein [Panacagrimonas sp.]MCC2657375.1 gluconolactonase [Panacagrimonas sp.]
MKRLAWILPLLLVLYLVAWPADISPVAWNPPEAPSMEEGLYAKDDALRGVQRIADGGVVGPEAITFDANGRLYTGLEDGRVVSMAVDGSDCRVLVDTGGRPGGLKVQADGSVIVADLVKGLLRIDGNGKLELLDKEVDGWPVGIADDLDLDARGRVFFSDASWKFTYDRLVLDALEHGGRGRLFLYDPQQKASATVLAQLEFANGVTIGPDEQYVLVNETTAYRIKRYWMKGERSGQVDTFVDNLPGLPDNITFNGSDRFWVALFGPRDPMIDALGPVPFLRSVIARLPVAWLPKGARQGFVLGLDLDGKVVEQYRYAGDGAFGPVTSVIERDGMLYLGSLTDTAIGRISLADLRAGKTAIEPPPPIKGSCTS